MNIGKRFPSADIVRQGGRKAVEEVIQALINSHWPDCDQLAEVLSQVGDDDAKAGLFRALKARRHHIRSAAVKALVKIGGPDVIEAIMKLEADPAYEVRQDVAEALRQLDEQKG